jgi:hypothetical protein
VANEKWLDPAFALAEFAGFEESGDEIAELLIQPAARKSSFVPYMILARLKLGIKKLLASALNCTC